MEIKDGLQLFLRKQFASVLFLAEQYPQGIIRTSVGIPSLVFSFRPRFFIFLTQDYYFALGFSLLSTFATIQPQVFSFFLPQVTILLQVFHSNLGWATIPPQASIQQGRVVEDHTQTNRNVTQTIQTFCICFDF